MANRILFLVVMLLCGGLVLVASRNAADGQELGSCSSKTIQTKQDENCKAPYATCMPDHEQEKTCEKYETPYFCANTMGQPSAGYWKVDALLKMGTCVKPTDYNEIAKGCKTCVADKDGYTWMCAFGRRYIYRKEDEETKKLYCDVPCLEVWKQWTKMTNCTTEAIF